MWPFKTPIWQEVNRKFLCSKMEACEGGYGMGTDVDVFNIYAVTYKDLISGKTKIQEEYELA